MKTHHLWITTLTLLLLTILTACQPAPPGDILFPTQALMQVEDLPNLWVWNGSSAVRVPDALTSHDTSFSAPNINKDLIPISHQIAVYADPQAARDSLPWWEEEWLPGDEWQTPPESTFTPADPADNYRLGCIPIRSGQVDMLACRSIQQHASLVSVVVAQIDNHAISFAQFDYALRQIDTRLQASTAES